MWLWPPRSRIFCTCVSTSWSLSPMPTMRCAPNRSGPKISAAAWRISQYLSQLCGDCTPRPRVRSNTSGLQASSATVKISAPRSYSSCTSSRVMVVGFDRIDTGTCLMRSTHFFSTTRVSSSERGCVIMLMHMRWKRPPSPPGGDDVDHLVVRNCRPVDADEVAVGIVAFGLAMARQPAIGAIGAAALRICEQEVQAARAAGAVHVAVHHAERDRRRGRHLDVFGRAHVGREKIVVRQVDALGLDVLRFHARAVARVCRDRAGRAWLHRAGVVEGALLVAEEIGRRLSWHFETAHDFLSWICVFMPPNSVGEPIHPSASARASGRPPPW